jgi:hypothetical protein
MATWHRQQQALVNQLPPAWQRRWRRTSPCEWPEPTEPRALMARWLSEAHIPAAGLDQIPHDLWAARELPPLDMLQRLVITLAGFQLAPRVNADGSVTIVPLSSETTVTDAYRLPPQRLGEIDQLRSELPGAQLTLRQRTLTVVGRAEDHDRVRDWLQGQQRRTPSGGSLADKRFTLTVQNQPIAAILQAVAQQLDLELVWHDATQSWREDRVSLSVKNATLGELITTVLEGRSARYRLQGRRLIIAPASSAER